LEDKISDNEKNQSHLFASVGQEQTPNEKSEEQESGMSSFMKNMDNITKQVNDCLNKNFQTDEEEKKKEEEARKQVEKENLSFFVPFTQINKRTETLFNCFSDIDKRDYQQGFLDKVHQSLKLIDDISKENDFTLIKRYQINNNLAPIKEKYIEKLSRSGIPSGTTYYKCRDFDTDDDDVVEEYVDELNDYFDDQIECMKDELEALYNQYMGEYLKPENYKTERVMLIVQNLVEKLNAIWGDQIFTVSEKEYEPDMKSVMNIYGISALLLPHTEFNEYENFFNRWFSKTTLPESQIREFCSGGRKTVKEIVETTRDRFISEIHKSLYPIELYLKAYSEKIAEMCKENENRY
jgi:hypothetical protein